MHPRMMVAAECIRIYSVVWVIGLRMGSVMADNSNLPSRTYARCEPFLFCSLQGALLLQLWALFITFSDERSALCAVTQSPPTMISGACP